VVGADAAVNVVDATGNAIAVRGVAAPAISSSTYNAGTGVLVVTGTGFLKKVAHPMILMCPCLLLPAKAVTSIR